MTPYPSEIEQQMQRLYSSLNEKDRRRYAGIESVKLGWGGMFDIQNATKEERGSINSASEEALRL